MPLVFGDTAPHSGDILVEIAGDPSVMAKTPAGKEEMGRRYVGRSVRDARAPR